jgi:hypothetical protein
LLRSAFDVADKIYAECSKHPERKI